MAISAPSAVMLLVSPIEGTDRKGLTRAGILARLIEVEHNTPQGSFTRERAVNVIRVFSGTCVIAGLFSACHKAPPADEHMAHMASADLRAPRPSASGTQGTAGIPASANTAQARVAASPRHGEWVKIAWEPGSSDSLMAWIVYPSTSRAKTPVVVVVHEIFGLQTWVRGVADARSSCVCVAWLLPPISTRRRSPAPSST